MIKLVLKGQIPSGKNAMQVTRSGHHYPLKRFTDWRSNAEVQVREQIGFPRTIDSPCTAVFAYYPGDSRRRDVPGMIDALFHLFERLYLVKDDSLIKNVRWMACPADRKNPRVLVSIEETVIGETING